MSAIAAHEKMSSVIDRLRTEYLSASDSWAMYAVIKLTAAERADKIIKENGIDGGATESEILTEIRGWMKDFDGSHQNFAAWNRQLRYAMDTVIDAWRNK